MLTLVTTGLDDCAISRVTGVPRRTVADWRRGIAPAGEVCPRSWQRARRIDLTCGDYAELLGLYLGDGHIAMLERTASPRLSLDAAHPAIVGSCTSLLQRSFPENRVQHVAADGGSTVVLTVYSGHLPCLFPQAAPGKKHARATRLESWQERHVAASPWRLLQGLIRSDGCVFVNRTGRYEYLSYDFCNRSSDILDLFCATCTAVGVDHRRYAQRVRI